MPDRGTPTLAQRYVFERDKDGDADGWRIDRLEPNGQTYICWDWWDDRYSEAQIQAMCDALNGVAARSASPEPRWETTGPVSNATARLVRAASPEHPSPPPDCSGAHGNNENGCCPRCGSAVRVVGFESCDCGREQIEQLVPSPDAPRHCCGARGFGLQDGDVCPACADAPRPSSTPMADEAIRNARQGVYDDTPRPPEPPKTRCPTCDAPAEMPRSMRDRWRYVADAPRPDAPHASAIRSHPWLANWRRDAVDQFVADVCGRASEGPREPSEAAVEAAERAELACKDSWRQRLRAAIAAAYAVDFGPSRGAET